MALHHIVLFKLADGDPNGPVAAQFDPLLQKLVETSPGVITRETQADLNLRPGNARSYQRMIHLTFADAVAWRTYLDSPEHQEFLGEIKGIVETIAGIQYEA